VASVVYDGPFSGVVLPDGRLFEKGKAVEVDDELADSLTRQEFKITESVKGKAA